MSRFLMIRNLLAMAAADGSITRDELELLAGRAVEWGLSESEFGLALGEAFSEDAEVEIPANQDERRELLQELLVVMAADGVLGAAEKQLFAAVAVMMEIDTPELNRIIDAALKDNSSEP